MENLDQKKIETKEQLITLSNRENLIITGTSKVISIKSDLIQLNTVYGGLIILGENLELTTLNNTTNNAEIRGTINSLKFIEGKEKEPFFRKIFKWFFQQQTN